MRDLNAEVIAISSRGDQADVQRTQRNLSLTFPVISSRKIAQDYNVFNMDKNWAIATVIVDKEGMIRFKHIGRDPTDRPGVSTIIKNLKEIK